MNERELLRRLKEDADRYNGDLDVDFNQDRPRKMKQMKDRGGYKPRRQKPQWKRSDDE